MYVCICNAVTERHIGEAVSEGVSTLRELRTRLGVAGECGRCATCARDCLRTAMAEQTTTAKPAMTAFAPSYSLAVEAV
ncbi:MAG: bacterioferritin-associated ferredoxin [Azoarcus sp.]|uniref:Bacterioferritin-associated ferredoxin n=1 Tax=Aromatoleum tolulyticum TaxID=34027 RepID=A0A1N6Z4X8_9RHOO|nr:(2Fe-2S)-binding protein [Aromatoleum tolulyticum]MCK9985350.1 bacterioferritin-associated ferredoxin [Azoarcus sp.]SIR21898.1 bacterioferritin-associated ferredoxin [Aromatoleum tolulyticum]